jgi:hypothetical protein
MTTEESEEKVAQALAEWPLVEPSPDQWERLCAQLDAKLGAQIDAKVVEAGRVQRAEDDDVDVLAPPLAATADEDVQNSPPLGSSRTLSGASIPGPDGSVSSSKDRKMSDVPSDRNRRSLKDLAKLASAPSLTPMPPKASPQIPSERPSAPKMGGDSGIVDLKAMSTRDPGAELRAKSTPLASAALFDEDEGGSPEAPSAAPSSSRDETTAPISSSVSSRGMVAAAPSSPASSRPALSASKAASALAAVGPEKKSNTALFAGIGVVAVAAAVVLFARSKHADSTVAMTATPAVVAAAPRTPAATTTSASPRPADTEQAVAAAGAPGAAGEAANQADPGAATKLAGPTGVGGGRKSYANPKAAPILGGTGGSSVSGLSAMMAQATKTPESPGEPPPPPAAPGALGAALKQAAGSNGASTTAADPAAPAAPQFAPGSVPDKPSQGAVTGALGVVLPQARNCLNPDDPISRANVTFSSSGSVSRVVVTGSAAGKPAEECIKGALMKATLSPFAQPSYAATVTVRPN